MSETSRTKENTFKKQTKKKKQKMIRSCGLWAWLRGDIITTTLTSVLVRNRMLVTHEEDDQHRSSVKIQ